MNDDPIVLDLDTAIDLAYSMAPEGYIYIDTETLGETRWGIVKRTIFIKTEGKEGKYYAFEWEQGATEMQEDEFDDPVRAYRVRPVEVTVTQYQKVEEE